MRVAIAAIRAFAALLRAAADAAIAPVVAAAFLAVSTGAHAQAVVNPSIGQVFDGGTVKAIAVQADGKVIIGGSFKTVNGFPRNNLARLNADGSLDAAWDPNVGGGAGSFAEVSALVLDGSGGVFVGGFFATVGGQSRNGLAKISTTGSGAVDATWNPGANNNVWSLALEGSNLYVAGTFTAIGGQSRSNLARVSAVGTGLLDTTWSPAADSSVSTLALDGAGSIYVGGSFANIGGQARANIAKLSTSGSGAADLAWNPGASSGVSALALDGGGSLFAGGYFSTIGGLGRGFLAKLSTATGAVDASWNPNANGQCCTNGVFSLALDGSGNAYVGGTFSTVGGQVRNHIGKVSTSGTGTLDATWNANAEETVHALALGSGGLYAGGSFRDIGGLSRGGFAALSTTTGAADSAWARVLAPGHVYAVVRDTLGRTVIGGRFVTVGDGTTVRRNLARFNSDGSLDAWNPTTNAHVQVLALDNAAGFVYAGGSFTIAGAQARNHLARFSDVGAGATDGTWNPGPDNYVFALAPDGAGNIYVGGYFANIGGQARQYVAKIATTGTGPADATWNPNASAPGPIVGVFALALDGAGSLYAGGGFNTIGGQARNNLAKLSTSGIGAADATWNPNPNNIVVAMALDGSGSLYVGSGGFFGGFTSIGGQSRNYLAKVSTGGTGGADAIWNPNPDGAVSSLALDGSGALYVGGGGFFAEQFSFTSIGGQSRNRLARLSTSGTGSADANWNAASNGSVSALAVDGAGNVYAGGLFTSITGQARIG